MVINNFIRLKVIGITSIGRTTCDRLDFNDREHDDGFIISSRQLWIIAGWHPPNNDPCQKE